jgi:hypothetical protein
VEQQNRSRWAWGAGVALVLVLVLAFAGAALVRDTADLSPEAGVLEAGVVPGEVLGRPGGGASDGTGADGAGADGAGADGAGVVGADGAGGRGEASPAAGSPGDWVSAAEPSPVATVPASQRVPAPAAVRGIYTASVSGPRLASLLRLADETEVNAFVVDIKDDVGQVTHPTRVPLARQVGAQRSHIPDLAALVARLREHGVYPIARIVVFKDPLLANARPEWSIRRDDGSVWADNRGVHWVDPFNREVWDYNIELAREAIALGFSEVQWDYVRFPDVPGSYLRTAVYPARDGQAMADGIREFMIYARERLGDLGVPLTADVFGVTTSARGDVGIGQVWEKLADVTDVLLPMVYPSHYARGTWGHNVPNAAPYQVVRRAVEEGLARSAVIPGAASMRPWLQAFSLGQPPYGPREVRAQMQAVYDAGVQEWILWNAAARYDAAYFATPDGRAPDLGDLRAPAVMPAPAPGPAPADDLLGVPAAT